MKITRENYEPFFLDYLEGNLEEHMVDEFIEFLQQNADLKEELQQFEAVTITPDKVGFDGRHNLYRQSLDLPEEFENKAVAWLEGDLDEKERAGFDAYIDTHPDKKRELELFMKTKLYPDKNVIFRHTSKLYRKPYIQDLLFMGFRVAAILLVAIMVWTLWPSNDYNIKDQYVDHNPPVTVTPDNVDRDKVQPVFEEIEIEPVASLNPHTSPQAVTVNQLNNTEKQWASNSLEERRGTIELSELPVKKAFVQTVSEKTPLENMAFKEILDSFPEFSGEEYLSDRLKERLGINPFSFRELVHSGLKLASDISGDRIGFTTGQAGEVIALSLDTRLLGLKIPVGRK